MAMGPTSTRTRLNRLQAQLMLEDDRPRVTPVVITYPDGTFAVDGQQLADQAALDAFLATYWRGSRHPDQHMAMFIPDNGRDIR